MFTNPSCSYSFFYYTTYSYTLPSFTHYVCCIVLFLSHLALLAFLIFSSYPRLFFFSFLFIFLLTMRLSLILLLLTFLNSSYLHFVSPVLFRSFSPYPPLPSFSFSFSFTIFLLLLSCSLSATSSSNPASPGPTSRASAPDSRAASWWRL